MYRYGNSSSSPCSGSSAFSFSPAGAPGLGKATGMREVSSGYPGAAMPQPSSAAAAQQLSSDALASSSGYGFQKKHLQPQYVEEGPSGSVTDDLEDYQGQKYINGGLGFRQSPSYPTRAAARITVNES